MASVVFFRNIMNNKVFYQHPNLMRALGMHETVMEVMVNVLGGGGDSKVTVISSSLSLSRPAIYNKAHIRHYASEKNVFWFFCPGDSIPPNGDQLLSFPVLLLPYQPTEPAFYVWPSELPVTEQWHRLGWVPCYTVYCIVYMAYYGQILFLNVFYFE